MVAAGARDPEGLRRGRRLHLGRARHRPREGGLHAAHLLRGRSRLHAAGCRSAFNPTGLCNPGKIFPTQQGLRRGRPGLPPASDRREGPRPALLARAWTTPRAASSARQASRHRRRPPRAHRASTARRTSSRAARPRPWCFPGIEGGGRRGPRWLAAEAGLPVTPWGGGTKMAIGPPPDAHRASSSALKRLNRLLEHEPGDLTVTVEAGMTARARFQARARPARPVALARPARRPSARRSAACSRAMRRARAGISTAPRAIC